MMRTPFERPLMIRFRAGNRHASGVVPGANSLRTAPSFAIRSINPRLDAG
jgi:hypothetical protein